MTHIFTPIPHGVPGVPKELPEDRYSVSELIDGDEYRVATDGKEVWFGNSTGWLEEEDPYIGHVLKARILDMFNNMKEMIMEQHRAADHAEAEGSEVNRPDIPRDFQMLELVGVLYGGKYPEVPEVMGVKPIKSSVYYSQEHSFAMFAMYVDNDLQDTATMGAMALSFHIPTVPMGLFGTTEECLEYIEQHKHDNTTLPSRMPLLDVAGQPEWQVEGESYKRLPEIPGNTLKGFVMSPTSSTDIRYIFK